MRTERCYNIEHHKDFVKMSAFYRVISSGNGNGNFSENLTDCTIWVERNFHYFSYLKRGKILWFDKIRDKNVCFEHYLFFLQSYIKYKSHWNSIHSLNVLFTIRHHFWTWHEWLTLKNGTKHLPSNIIWKVYRSINACHCLNY